MPQVTATNGTNTELAQELYDALMADIEPDLLLTNIPTLDAKYAEETPVEHDARMKRYEAAYKTFDQAFAAFMGDVNAEVRTSRRESLQSNEASDRTQETNALQSLEVAFR